MPDLVPKRYDVVRQVQAVVLENRCDAGHSLEGASVLNGYYLRPHSPQTQKDVRYTTIRQLAVKTPKHQL